MVPILVLLSLFLAFFGFIGGLAGELSAGVSLLLLAIWVGVMARLRQAGGQQKQLFGWLKEFFDELAPRKNRQGP